MPTKNETYEAKAVDKSNVSSWDDPVLSDMVDTEARRNRVMRGLSRDVVDISGAPTDTYKARSRGALEAESQTENEQISDEDITRDTTDISVSKYGKRVVLTTEGEEDGMDSQADEIAEELGQALADKEDQEAYDTVADESLSDVETVTADSDGSVAFTDLNTLRSKLRGNNRDPDALVVHPDHEADLISEEKFTKADYQSNRPVENGEFGQILSMTVYVTTAANESSSDSDAVQAVMLDTSAAFDTVIKRGPTVESDREIDYDRWQIAGTMRFGHGVINEDAIGHVVNSSA